MARHDAAIPTAIGKQGPGRFANGFFDGGSIGLPRANETLEGYQLSLAIDPSMPASSAISCIGRAGWPGDQSSLRKQRCARVASNQAYIFPSKQRAKEL